MRETRRRGRGTAVLDGVHTRCAWGARAFDLALTLLVLPLAAALAALVALAVALDSPGPLLFRSTRVGRDGRLFRMVKFRTMRHQETGPKVSSQDDARYTPIGRLLAASRLDELPQLWNVLRGQMRLVGPRPEIEEFVLDQADSYRRILSVPPGITGPTQIRFADEGRLLAGSSDPERVYRRDLLPEKVRLDIDYVTKGSRVADSLLLVLTWAVPVRQVARSLTGSSQRSGARAGAAVARAATLVAAVMMMVALFAAEGASAQAAEAPVSDPNATSPAGDVYALPLDDARRDGAPRMRPRRRHGSGGGGTSGRRPPGGHPTDRSVGRGTASPIRSENNFGSSSRVPGVDHPPADSSLATAAGVRKGGERGGSYRGDGSRRTGPGSRSAAPVAAISPGANETDESGPSRSLVLALAGLLVVVGIAVGTLAGRARRS